MYWSVQTICTLTNKLERHFRLTRPWEFYVFNLTYKGTQPTIFITFCHENSFKPPISLVLCHFRMNPGLSYQLTQFIELEEVFLISLLDWDFPRGERNTRHKFLGFVIHRFLRRKKAILICGLSDIETDNKLCDRVWGVLHWLVQLVNNCIDFKCNIIKQKSQWRFPMKCYPDKLR